LKLSDAKIKELDSDLLNKDDLINAFNDNPVFLESWSGLSDYLNTFAKLTPAVRYQSCKAMIKYPKKYVEAVEKVGMSRFELFKRHASDYGDEYYKMIDDFMHKSSHGLTETEAYAIFGYTTNFYYKNVNAWLRAGIHPEKTNDLVNLIRSGLDKLPSWKGGYAFRGIKIKPPDGEAEIKDIVSRYSKGKSVQHGEFVSAGSSREASFLDDPRVKIEMEFILKPQSSAKDISELADGVHYRGNPPSELIFPAGTRFRVFDSPSFENGKWIIKLVEE
jgi:hypothetical protein